MHSLFRYPVLTCAPAHQRVCGSLNIRELPAAHVRLASRALFRRPAASGTGMACNNSHDTFLAALACWLEILNSPISSPPLPHFLLCFFIPSLSLTHHLFSSPSHLPPWVHPLSSTGQECRRVRRGTGKKRFEGGAMGWMLAVVNTQAANKFDLEWKGTSVTRHDELVYPHDDHWKNDTSHKTRSQQQYDEEWHPRWLCSPTNRKTQIPLLFLEEEKGQGLHNCRDPVPAL